MVKSLLIAGVVALGLTAETAEVWHFNSTAKIGGHKTTVLGNPAVVKTPAGEAVQFNGVDDALYVDVHPLSHARTFTWEVIFRPDAGGRPEQRFFHLQEIDLNTAKDTQTRMLMEIRVIGDQWCLDSFALTGANSKALMDRSKLHPLGAWYNATAVYDGHMFRNYVDGVLQGEGELKLGEQGDGHTSMGTRIDKRDFFKGAILEARMTRHALPVSEFLKAPK